MPESTLTGQPFLSEKGRYSCPHFGECGGCSSQETDYARQLAGKEDRVRRVVAPFSPELFHPIQPSPQIFYYRNKMEFVFGGRRPGPVILGLRARGQFDRLVDVKTCFLMSEEIPALLRTVRGWADREVIPTYHLRAHKGFLRYLVIREGKNTNQRLIHLVTAPEDCLDLRQKSSWKQTMRKALVAGGVSVDSVVWSVNRTVSDVARGQTFQTLFGTGCFEEVLVGRRFRLSATSFFQTNTRGAEILYKIVGRRLGNVDVLFDLYCGSGSIGLFCSGQCRRLIGIESHTPAVEDARLNAGYQGVSSAEFHVLDAANLPQHEELISVWTQGNVSAVVDPPRPGLQPGVRRLLMESPLNRWIYVSCNPESLARDLSFLSETYAVESVDSVDLFPHTPHVESVVTLRRRS